MACSWFTRSLLDMQEAVRQAVVGNTSKETSQLDSYVKKPNIFFSRFFIFDLYFDAVYVFVSSVIFMLGPYYST